jgi:hypothetical protein
MRRCLYPRAGARTRGYGTVDDVVIGDRFAWGHLEKTGGDATLELFGEVSELVRFADPADTHDKHCEFRSREPEVKGKVLALNFRRLPAWILSKAHHKARYGTFPDFEPDFMASPQEMAQSRDPDERLAAFTDNGRFAIERWLRLEFLAQDFIVLVAEFTDLTEAKRKDILELAGIHERSGEPYDRRLDHWFSHDQVRTMYENNPVWAALERRLYGGVTGV